MLQQIQVQINPYHTFQLSHRTNFKSDSLSVVHRVHQARSERENRSFVNRTASVRPIAACEVNRSGSLPASIHSSRRDHRCCITDRASCATRRSLIVTCRRHRPEQMGQISRLARWEGRRHKKKQDNSLGEFFRRASNLQRQLRRRIYVLFRLFFVR